MSAWTPHHVLVTNSLPWTENETQFVITHSKQLLAHLAGDSTRSRMIPKPLALSSTADETAAYFRELFSDQLKDKKFAYGTVSPNGVLSLFGQDCSLLTARTLKQHTADKTVIWIVPQGPRSR